MYMMTHRDMLIHIHINAEKQSLRQTATQRHFVYMREENS